jgi:hypothetical protein
VLESFTSEADTFLVTTGACDGSINQGSATNLNVSSGYLALVRFAWSDAAEAAWAAGQLTSLTLTIDENPTCNGGCAVNHAPGVFSVHPARTDWSEGNGTPYNGADFCRRTTGTGGGTGNGWGIGLVKASSGTSITATVDYGGPSIADFILVASGKKLTFTLPVATARFSMHEPNKIAFLLSGAGSATFFGAARESGTHPAPKLVVGYCP